MIGEELWAPNTIVQIEWKDVDGAFRKSVGYLGLVDEQMVHICQSINTDGLINGLLSIPKSCVTQIIRFVENDRVTFK